MDHVRVRRAARHLGVIGVLGAVLAALVGLGVPAYGADDAVAKIKVGYFPTDLVLDSSRGRAYVVNSDSDSVSVVDLSINSVIATIPVPSDPRELLLDPTRNRAYVTFMRSNTVTVIDTVSNSVVATIQFNGNVGGGLLDAARARLYVQVSSGTGSELSVIDVNSNTVVSTVPLRDSGRLIADPDRHQLYVLHPRSDSISVIDTRSDAVVATFPVKDPVHAVTDPGRARLYVASDVLNDDAGFVSVIDMGANTVLATTETPDVDDLVIDPGRSRLYLTGDEENTISVMDTNTNTVTGRIPLGGNNELWQGLTLDAVNHRLYAPVTSFESFSDGRYVVDNVSVIDTASDAVVATLKGSGRGFQLRDIALDPARGRVYVIEMDRDIGDATTGNLLAFRLRTTFPPSAPQDTRITKAVGSSATLAWGAPIWSGSGKVTGYTVTALPGGRVCRTKSLTCTVTGLKAGTRYSFQVRAINRVGPGTPARTNPASW